MSFPGKLIENLEIRLDDFDLKIRKESLDALNELAISGSIPIEPELEIANLHCHSFFSYNGYGYSPSHLAWLGKKHGIKYMGIVDFDVLDGVDEFLDACQFLGIRCTAGMETRVFIPEFADIEINSPGEPGVCYYMGTGFTTSTAPESAHRVLEDIRLRVAHRNCQILEKINRFLSPLSIDFERDILPLTPSGNATERHIVTKIVDRACLDFDDPAQFWSEKLELAVEMVKKEMAEPEGFNNLIRKKLMKRGGIGYSQPTVNTFPLIDEFNRVIFSCHAIPCAAWLDGTSPGEQIIEKLLAVLINKGTAAINIIPERNWNYKDSNEKAKKLENLHHVIQVACDLHLPVIIGTEMNSFGQILFDDLNAPDLAPMKNIFLQGADFLFGHTQMEKKWGMGYQSGWALKFFDERKSKNKFFTAAGQLISPKTFSSKDLIPINSELSPEEVLSRLKDIRSNNVKQ